PEAMLPGHFSWATKRYGARPTSVPARATADLQPLHEHVFEEAGGILEAPLAGASLTEHRADLNVEIGIMLRRRPDREDQVIGIAAADLAGLDPGADDLRLLVHQSLQGTVQLIGNVRRTLQHLIGEETALTRIVARHFKLAANIGAD